MPKQDRTDTHSDVEDMSVHLKPILGVRPGTYLTALYGVILLLLIFFFLFFPGIKNRGAYLVVTTFPEHAVVSVDGQYAGSTPCTIFLKHGARTVELAKPFYSAVSVQQNVGGRVFGTLFVRDKTPLTRTLVLADLSGLLKATLLDFQKNPEIPSLVSDAALASSGGNGQDQLFTFLSDAMGTVTSEAQLRELVSAAGRVAARGTFLTPSSFVMMLQHAAQITQKYDNFPSWLLLSLSKPNANKLAATPWAQQYLAGYSDALSRYYQPGGSLPSSASGGSVSVGGVTLRAIPSGDLVMGKDDNLSALGKSVDRFLPHPVHVDAFYLGATEVTNGQFQAFVSENPEWAPSNRDALIAKGLVTDTYLAQWGTGSSPASAYNLPVSSVSWNAAVAYTGWLSRRVQTSLPGYIARLPLESEWEWAARGGLRGMPYPLGGKPGNAVFFQKGITGPSPAGASEPNAYGLRDMLGNVWEWCADPFTLNANLLSSLDPRKSLQLERSLPDSPDRVVRGGGWGNQPGTDKVYSRGYQPIDWCTPYLGFRVTVARQ
jgi:formylglycine-generating enzyme required for sulfatase activity